MIATPLYYTAASLTRSREVNAEPTILGRRELRGFFPARATLDLDCSGDGWTVRASIANSPIEVEASKQKMIDALKTALALAEAFEP